MLGSRHQVNANQPLQVVRSSSPGPAPPRMISLQSSFEYFGGNAPEEAVPVTVRNPTFSSSLLDQWDRIARLERHHDSETLFYLNLREKTYLAQIPIRNVFLSPVAVTIATWTDYLHRRDNGLPKVDHLTIAFDVNIQGESDSSLNRFEAIWFSTAVVSPLTGGPDTPVPPLGDFRNFHGVPSDEEFEKTCYLLNKEVYMDFIKQLWPSLAPERHAVLLYIINTLVDFKNGNGTPQFKIEGYELESKVNLLLLEFQLIGDGRVYNYVQANFSRLFDFPLRFTALRRLKIGGNVHVKKLADGTVPSVNFDLYHLTVDYFTGLGDGQSSVPHARKYSWNSAGAMREKDQILFEFVEPVYAKDVSGSVVIRLKSFNGSEIYREEFKTGDPKLIQLDIAIPSTQPAILGPLLPGAIGPGKLRGTVVSLSKSCTLKGIVVVQAKTSDEGQWATVATAKSDKDGNFSMQYPYGQFTQARAIFSLSPNNPTTLSTTPSKTLESISYDFIYILLQGSVDSPTNKDDCNCKPGTLAERLPSHDDLIQSNQFTQDMGGGCLHLTVPNRTLREFTYTALVRHTDPDVANYTLRSVTVSAQSDDDVESRTFYLEKGAKVDRPVIDFDHLVQWEDVTDSEQHLYQAVTVSTGHVLHYKSEFRADGYSLGDLLYSLPLAPGQKKQIVTLDSSHTFTGAETQGLSATEKLANNLISDRSIVDQIAGDIGENMFGSSSATTSGVSAAVGASGSYAGMFGGSLGVAGGTSTSSSHAGQNSGRSMSQFFAERLRQGLQQNASSYRQQNATVVTAVQEGQHYQATTEAIANHNHCHSLTMMYFEVLRHFAVFQELVDAEECVFVPLIMTKFGLENISRWADVLAPRLLQLHANTFIQSFRSFGFRLGHPLLPAFDAAERVRTRWKTVDYPQHRYCDENIQRIYGEFDIVAAFPRPTTKYDHILSLPVVTYTTVTQRQVQSKVVMDQVVGVLHGGRIKTKIVTDIQRYEASARIFDQFMRLDDNFQKVKPARCIRVNNFSPGPIESPEEDGTNVVLNPMTDFFDGSEKSAWRAYAIIIDQDKYGGIDGLEKMMQDFFGGQLIGDWDQIWYEQMVPIIFKHLHEAIVTDATTMLDTTNLRGYTGRAQGVVKVSFTGHATIQRAALSSINFKIDDSRGFATKIKALRLSQMVFRLNSARIRYATAHYEGTMFSGAIQNDIVDGALVPTPLTDAEKQNPRKNDGFLTQRLTTHLNQNLEYYNRALWSSLDEQRRFLLLDGFKIQTFNKFGEDDGFRSLSSVLKNHLLGVVGNSLVFPVAPGYHVAQSFVVASQKDSAQLESESLVEHYRPENPPPPYRMSVPTRGVYSEAVIGQCDSCEKIKPESSQDWTKFGTEEPTAINPITAPVPTVTEYQPQVKDFAPPMVQIQNAPSAPDPGIGLRALTELMGKSGVFKDITGLEGNQRNAIETYRANQEAAQKIAETSSVTAMANQAHNTSNSSKIMDTVNSGYSQGVLSDDERKQLTKDHIQQMIDGGATKAGERAEERVKGRQVVADRISKAAVEQGREMNSTNTDVDGSVQTISIKGNLKPTFPLETLAEAPGLLPRAKQPDDNTCWAALVAMMVGWKWQVQLDIDLAVAEAGDEYVQKFKHKAALRALDGPDLLGRLGLVSEPGVRRAYTDYVKLLKDFGPLWLTIDSTPGRGWSPHAVLLVKIEGYSGAPDDQVIFHLVDPAKVKDPLNLKEALDQMKYSDLLKALTEVLTDADPRSSGMQQLTGLQIIHWPYDIPARIGSKVGHHFVKITPPVHEYLTLWALRGSTNRITTASKPGNDKPTDEFLRGVYWNDDPDLLLFNLMKDKNYEESTGALWYYEFLDAGAAIAQGLNAVALSPNLVGPPGFMASFQPRSTWQRPRMESFNMTRRSHFGDLQFLHAMASTGGEKPLDTHNKIMTWIEVMYQLAIGNLDANTRIDDANTSGPGPALNEFFTADTSPSNRDTLSRLLARFEQYVEMDLQRRALGSILHLVQDSYARGHVKRENIQPENGQTAEYQKLGAILRHFVYSEDDEKEHSKYDGGLMQPENIREIKGWNDLLGARDAINEGKQLIDLWTRSAPWEEAKIWAERVFRLSKDATPSTTFAPDKDFGR